MGCGSSTRANAEAPQERAPNAAAAAPPADAQKTPSAPAAPAPKAAAPPPEKEPTPTPAAPVTPAEPPGPCKLRVIFVNDVYELDNWPRFLTAVDTLTENKDNTLVLLPGDFVAPSLLSSLDHARGMIDCMNRCKFQYVCFGNHETDIPHAELINRIKDSSFKWINSNMPDLDLGGIKLPEYEEITVKGGGQIRRVGLIGLLTEDPALYRPGAFGGATITPVKDEAEKLQKKLCGEMGMDLVLPMTHQVISLDRKFMEHFKGKGIDNENAFPLIIGAHDHEPYAEEVGGSKVLKTGSDAKAVGICDIVWNDPKSKKVEVTTRMQPIEDFAPNPLLQQVVNKHQAVLKELDTAPLFLCEGEQLNSKNNRIQQTSLGTKLVSSLRDALGADCCVLNAGNIRGNKVYEEDKKYFTYNDLKTEIPFDAEMVVMPLPGKTISGAVKFTREKSFLDPPVSFGGYMQISDDMTFDNATQEVTHIKGEPIDPNKIYSCGILFMVMTGVDNITPLMEWAAEHADLLPIDGCAEMGRPAKLLLVDYFSKAIWYQMGAFKDIDEGGKGYISKEDVFKAASKHFGEDVAGIYVDNVMRAADVNKDGKITKDELMRVNMMNAWARRDMDLNNDGLLNRNEVEAFAKKILGDDYDNSIVDHLFTELDVEKKGSVDGKAVETWLARNFSLETVNVPGQTMERGEITAVKTRLLERAATKDESEMDLCRLRVIFVNDVYELDNWPRFITAVNNLTEDKENTIVLLPGDFVAPSLLSSLDQAKGMIDCMNQCHFQYVCFGNHETDIPHSELIARIKESNFKWINSNMTDIDLGGIKLPEYEEITVKGGGQTRRVGLIGLLTEDPALYRPGAFGGATITPVKDEAEKFQKKLCGEMGMDLVLPMTHQVISLDKAFMEYFKGKGIDNENAFPLIIGAHDHEPYEIELAGSKVLKTGSDAKAVGICDIVWPDANSKKVEVSMRMEPIEQFGPNPMVQKTVDKHQAVLKELDTAPLFNCEGEQLNSKNNRIQQTSLGTKLVSSLRDALGADCCVLNAGNIRGNKVYEEDKKYFTYNDLKTEIPFDAEMVVMPLPGKVISETVKFTREKSFLDPPVSFGGYMQISDDMTFDNETQSVTHIKGEPLDPEKIYSCGILFMVMTGVDSITPLMEWAAEHADLLPIDGCAEMGRPAKLLLVDYFSKAIWYQMGAFKDIDEGGKGYISREDVHKAASKHFGEEVAKIYVDNVMRAADVNKDGKITKDELMRVNMMNAWARRDMDLNKDGVLDRNEIETFTKKILGDDYDKAIVDRVFDELDKEKKGHVDGRAVERWLGQNFSLESVSVPGQSLERGEITAVKTRLLERANSKDEAEMDLCRLRVIFVNDVYELDNWPRFITAVNNLTEDKENTIVLLPGDFVAPSLLSSLDQAKGMIDCMNQCRFQYVCFGNHECDIPHSELIARIKESNFKWINSNMPDLDLGGIKLPEYEEITVKGGGQTRRVGLIGLLTEDPALYRPGAFGGATITPVKDEAEKLQKKLCGEMGMDLVLPMTHQVIGLDKAFMEYFKGKGIDNENAFPLIIGAHDHEPYEIELAGSKVLKTGCDCKAVGICDIVWPDANSKKVEVSMRMEPIDKFGPNPMVQRTVEKHQSCLKELDTAPLFNCEGEQLSSKTNRIQQTSLGTKLVSSLRDALGADCCVLNAGNIRGNKVYEEDKKYFTYNDLKTEIPFDAEMVVMPLPGKVISETVKFTREKSFLDPPVSFGGYMQISDDMTFDNETQSVTHIKGEPLDPEKIYSCGILFMVMTGVDNITPLMDWAAKNSHLFPTDACSEMGRPAKLLLVDYFSKAIWYQMGAFKDIDEEGKGYISPENVHKAASAHFGEDVAKIYVDNVMRAADVNKDGKITKDELFRVNMMNAWARRDMDLNKDGVLDKEEVETFAKKILGEDFDHTLVDTLFTKLDTEGKGHIDGRAVEQWMAKEFGLETVSVPGQTLERQEIAAVKTRLLERSNSRDEAEMEMCRLRILFVNDVYELDNWPRFITAVNNLTVEKENTIVLLPGDFVAPSLLSSLDHARGMIDCMNQVKIQYVCFGNHETDIPHSELIARIKESNFKWINSNMTDINLGDLKLPEYEEITVKGAGQTRRVGLIGLLTEDPALYRPGAFGGATITPVKDEAEKLQKKLCGEMGMDLVLPMTHQVIGLDKEFMEYFKGKGIDNENAFPLVIGAHDHEPYEIELAGSKVLKTGSDAKAIGVCDIVWPDANSKKVEVSMRLESIEQFGPNPMVQKIVDKHQSCLKELDTAPLFNCEGEQLSSKTNRIQQTSLGTKLVSSLRDALGADCCVLNAGNIRGNKVYEEDKKYFTYNDLKTEIPFDAEMVVMPLPGKVISETVKFTREKSFLDPPVSFGGYMQISDDMTFDDATQSVTHIKGEPLDPEKIYSCGILFMVMTGVDNITPLMDWASGNSHLFPLDACAEMGRPAKLLLVDYFSKAIWYQMGAFKDIDQDNKGYISPEDVAKAAEKHFKEPVAKIYVDNVMRAADVNKDGKITKDELMRVNMMNAWARRDMDLNKDGVLDKEEVETFAKKILGEDFDHTLVDTLFTKLDTEGKGHIDGRAVEQWMAKDFSLESVTVPGQTLERGEITAVKTRLLEKSNSQSADSLDLCRLKIIFVNDVYELDNWPRFITAVNNLTEDKENTIVLLPGDFVAPSLLSSLDQGRGMIDCMNQVKIQYVCFGNHECDIPFPEMVERIKESNFKWINSNMPDLDLGDIKLPEFEEITVKGGGQTRRVGLIGLLTEDPALYRMDSFGGCKILPVKDEAERLQKKLCGEMGMDLVLPMTHQVVSLDKAFMEYFKGKGIDNENAFPLIIGAHDHEPYEISEAGAKLLKTGCDCKAVGVCDIVWPDPNSKKVEVSMRMEPIDKFGPNPMVQKTVEKHQSVLKELDTAPLFNCEGEVLTSKNNRIQQTNMGTKLVSSLRDALGCDCCVLNAGNIRGNKDYEADKKYFTYNDLKTEMPFDAEMAVMPLPGKVIAEAVKFTRAKSILDPPVSFAGYMQISDDMIYDEATQTLTHICNEPVDPEKIYTMGIKFLVMAGLDNITPLMEWASKNSHLFPVDVCEDIGRPAKLLLVDYFSRAIWYQMGAFKDIDQDNKGYISPEDVAKAAEKHFKEPVAKIYVDNVMRAADVNKDGKITKDELFRVNMMNAWARRDMDLNKDGVLDKEEVETFAKKILGDDFDHTLVDSIFAEVDKEGSGKVDGRAVEQWLSKSFNLHTVRVPGQPLDRTEIKAVQDRLMQQAGSKETTDMCRLRVLFVNDVYELDNWPRFLTAVNKLTVDKDNTLILLPGDFVAPSLLSSLDHARGMIDCMNLAKIQYVCFGNHETDIPHAELINRIKESNFKWINSNMTDINLGDLKLPEYEEITVKGGGQTRRVGLIGLLTEDPALYRPGAFGGATITPVKDEAEKLQKKLCGEMGMDLVLPMTHQVISLDKEFMEYFKGKGIDNENAFPLIIGAHDHEPYEIELAGSKVLKTGSDAKAIGVCDIVWPDANSKKVGVGMKLEPIEQFDVDPELQKIVEKHQSCLKELDTAPLFNCEGEQLSSKTNRIQQTSLGTKLVSSLRDALGADCCVLNAGNIRGNKVYEEDKKYFTYNDLKTEIPFDAEMVVMPLPGQVISDTVKFTREKSFLDPPVSFGGYMQISDDMTFDDATQSVTHIKGEPLDPEKIYSCGILFMVMTGVDNITPLMDWASGNSHLFPTDACSELGRPAKLLLVDYFSKAIWYQMGAFKDIDQDNKGYISPEDVAKAAEKHFKEPVAKIYVDNVMRAADVNKDGKITKDELMRVNMMNAWARRDMDLNKDGVLDKEEVETFAKKILGEDFDHTLVDTLFTKLDTEGKGHIDGRAVEQWMANDFSLESVNVPGQTLERQEIKAVQERLLERSNSKDGKE